jgi:peptidoglycan/LPS O-acetylase OafA/YrhL
MALIVIAPVSQTFNHFFYSVILPPCICFLLLTTPVASNHIGRFFTSPKIAYLGKTTYTVYLWQELATSNYPSASMWWTPIFIVAAWAIGHFSYQYFETPIAQTAARWSDRIKRKKHGNLASKLQAT